MEKRDRLAFTLFSTDGVLVMPQKVNLKEKEKSYSHNTMLFAYNFRYVIWGKTYYVIYVPTQYVT